MRTASNPIAAVLFTVARSEYADAADATLLSRYAAARDDSAFAELVRRYNRLVWRTTRTAARNPTAAEDAFQATFLSLAKHAASIRNPAALAGWLHRTAHRVAVRARKTEAGRPLVSTPVRSAVGDDPLDQLSARELLAAVDEEIQALPETYRAAVVVCGVEGLSQEEAAARLGWSAGSVKGRLERGRARLRDRLASRGLTAPAALAGLLGAAGCVCAVPAGLAETTLAAVRGGDVSPAVAKLVAEVGGMSTFWLKSIAAVVVAAGGLALLAGHKPAGAPSPGPRIYAAPVPKGPGKLVLWEADILPDNGNPELKRHSRRRLAWFGTGVFTPDGKHVLTVGSSRRSFEEDQSCEVREWDAATGKVVRSYRGTCSTYYTGGVSPDGTMIVAAGVQVVPGRNHEWHVELWDRGADKPRLKIEGLAETAQGAAFSPDGQKIFAGEWLSGVLGWEVATGKRLFQARVKCWSGFAVHPGGEVLAVAGPESRITFIDTTTGQPRGTICLPSMINAHSVAFSRDGWTLAASLDGGVNEKNGVAFLNPPTLVLWHVTVPEGEPVVLSDGRESADHFREVKCGRLAFSPDDEHVAMAGGDGHVRLYDARTGKRHADAKEHTREVYAVAFSPDGKRLLTVGQDAVKVWSVAELLKRKPKD